MVMTVEYLYVNVFDKIFTEWLEVPGLNAYVYLASIDYPNEYIQSEGVENKEEGWFGFQNLSPGELTSVSLEVYCRVIEGNNIFKAIIDDGTGSTIEISLGTLSSWSWRIYSVLSHLDTVTKVNNAKVKFRSYRRIFDLNQKSCDSFDDRLKGWERIGSSPYLKYPSSWVQSEVKDDEIGDFGFYNIQTGLTDITAITLEIRSDQSGDDKLRIYIWRESTSSYVDLGTITPTTEWKSIDIFSVINTDQDVNAAKIYFVHEVVGAVNLIIVRQARLVVTYTQDGKQEIDCARLKVEYTPSAAAKSQYCDGFVCVG